MTGPCSGPPPVRVALIGTRGFGAVHLRNLERLTQEGRARLVGVVDVAEPPPELAGIHHPSLQALLAAVPEPPEVVIVSTPIDTHLPYALEALAAGCHVYLEKPPVPSLPEHARLLNAAAAAGRSVQVGFQASGGAGLTAMRAALAAGELGEDVRVEVHGAWLRDRAYYRRSRWAGRRRLDGHRVADGVATNPLAHAVHAGLAIAGMRGAADVSAVTTELRRAHDIEADDTTFLAVEPAGPGPGVTATLTTVAPAQSAPWVQLRGSAGTLRLLYTEDVTERCDGNGELRARSEHGRRDLLENLLEHVRAPEVGLISPLASTGAFTAVLEAIQAVPDPTPIAADHLRWCGEGEAAHPEVAELEAVMARALERGEPFSAVDAPWAEPSAVHRWSAGGGIDA